MGRYIQEQIRNYVRNSVVSEPPYELIHNSIGKLLWQQLSPEAIDAYAHIMIFFRQAPAQASFAEYHHKEDSGTTYRFAISHGKAFVLDSDNNYHQVRQMAEKDVDDEINDLPQIVTQNYFPH